MAKNGKKRIAVPVEFTTVTVNNDKLRVGIKVARDEFTPDDMDGHFTNAQLDCCITVNDSKAKDVPGQTIFDGHEFQLIGECMGFSVRSDHFKFSIAGTAPDDDGERGLWTRLSKKRGTIEFVRTGQADETAEAA